MVAEKSRRENSNSAYLPTRGVLRCGETVGRSEFRDNCGVYADVHRACVSAPSKPRAYVDLRNTPRPAPAVLTDVGIDDVSLTRGRNVFRDAIIGLYVVTVVAVFVRGDGRIWDGR